MSHIGDTISKTDVATQILYNRTLAQVGLCAFRAGLLKECRSCLGEVCKGGRVKELLAQGIAWKNRRYEEKDPAQENLEKRRLVPYHQHINLELIATYRHLSLQIVLSYLQIAQRVFAILLAPFDVIRWFSLVDPTLLKVLW